MIRVVPHKEDERRWIKRSSVMYIPQDEEDYYMHTGKLPKALAAASANVDLNGVRVPQRRNDDTYKMHKVMQCCVKIWLTTLQD